MRLIPSYPLNTVSRAELRVFDQLRIVFASDPACAWFSMHSLNLPRHEYKRFGEIDFIVCGPAGLFVLEIKGGKVACKEGVWETNNRYGTTDRLRESPFRQAEGALHGLRKMLPPDLEQAFVFGYGVVTPDVSILAEGIEWERAVLADAKDFKKFEKWLIQLIEHWRAKDVNRPPATPEQLKQIQQFLRPNFEAIASLHDESHLLESRIVKLTEDQFRLIDAFETNDRIICTGGAGTGKTMLGVELAKRWSAAGLNVAMTCHSPWLKSFLSQNKMPRLEICLSGSLCRTAKRLGINQFDAIIVDEGQDILDIDILSQVSDALKGGLDGGRWCFFHDVNNQSGLCGIYNPTAYEQLNKYFAAKISLTTNCRNSNQILHSIQSSLQADMGHSGVGDGPAVRSFGCKDLNTGLRILEQELNDLTEIEGFLDSDIVILSPLKFADSMASSLSQGWSQRLSRLDSASPLISSRSSIGFAQISDFKGLESRVIVLIDLPAPGLDSKSQSLHYVGMSRARAVLSVISITANPQTSLDAR